MPGTKFEVVSGNFTLNLEVPGCGVLNLSIGGKTIQPLESDSQLCFMSGEILSGMPTQSDVDAWVDSGDIYLLNQHGRKGMLVFASVSPESKTLLWIFSAPDDYSAIQLQLLDQLIDMP